VLQGKLWRGSRGAAGEIGHILIDPAGPRDQDGQPGALETMASGSGIASQWTSGDGSVRDMLAAADAGDAAALAIRGHLYDAVASAVRVLVLTMDPDIVVIGGGISALGAELLTPVREVIAGWEAGSSFISSLRLSERIRILPSDIPTAATGAAWLGATPWQR
jgi:predicted NBD/HSP70 family sugar kinase